MVVSHIWIKCVEVCNEEKAEMLIKYDDAKALLEKTLY